MVATVVRRRDEVLAILKALSSKSNCLYAHSIHVAHVAQGITKIISTNGYKSDLLSEEDIFLAGLLHDTGKLSIKDNILFKDTSLTEREMEAMRYHPQWGYDFLSDIASLRYLAIYALQHHEPAYPLKLRVDKILLPAKIINIADRFSAMSIDRSYRKAFSAKVAVSMLMDDITMFFGAHAPEIAHYLLTISGKHLRKVEDEFTDAVFTAHPETDSY